MFSDRLSILRQQYGNAPYKGTWGAYLRRPSNTTASERQDTPDSDDLSEEATSLYEKSMLVAFRIRPSSGRFTAFPIYAGESPTKALVDSLSEGKTLPKKIIVIDNDTQKLLKPVCKKLGIRLKRKKHCRRLEKAPDQVEKLLAATKETTDRLEKAWDRQEKENTLQP